MGKNKSSRKNSKRNQQDKQEDPRQHSRPLKRLILMWSLIAIGVGAGAFGLFTVLTRDNAGFDVTKECVTHGQLGMHIHPELSILINGGHLKIPANVGITSDCMRPIHTHDDSNQLHVEWTTKRDFTLGEFFTIWGKTFSKDQLFDYKTNASHTITLTVNGIPNKDYEKLVLRNNDKIVIEYKQR